MSITITATGRLTAEPEVRYTASGKAVVSFDLAHNFRQRSTGDEWADVATIFFHCSMWEDAGGLALVEAELSKGDVITVEGEWTKRPWTDRNSAQRISDELKLSNVKSRNAGTLLAGKPEAVK